MNSKDSTRKNRRGWNRTSDKYQAAHHEQLSKNQLAWGLWAIPEAQLKVLGDVSGKDVLEFGCGAAQWSMGLSKLGARVVGIDLSDRQLAHARRQMAEAGVHVPLVHCNAEDTPFDARSFDIVFCDHGAMTFGRPEKTVAEASRLLRPDGRFAFNMASPLQDVCWDYDAEAASERLCNTYFELGRIEEEDSTSYQRPYGEWIRLFREHSLVIENLIEPRPSLNASTTYSDSVTLDWARKWPAENIWILSKKRTT